MAGDGCREEVGPVYVDAPELAHAVDRVSGGFEVFGEAGGGDQVVDLAVGGDDFGDTGVDGGGVGDVGVVGCYFGDSVGLSVWKQRGAKGRQCTSWTKDSPS